MNEKDKYLKIKVIYNFLEEGGNPWEHPQPHGQLPAGDFTNSWDWLICLISKVEWICISEDLTSYFNVEGKYCIWHDGNLRIAMDKIQGVFR